MDKAVEEIIKNQKAIFKGTNRHAKEVLAIVKDMNFKIGGLILLETGGELEGSVSLEKMRTILKQANEVGLAAAAQLASVAQESMQAQIQSQTVAMAKEILSLNYNLDTPIYGPEIQAKIKALNVKPSPTILKAFLENEVSLLRGVTQYSRDSIRIALAQANLSSSSFAEVIRELQGTGLSKGIYKTAEKRAEAIAITESTRAYNVARQMAVDEVNRFLPDDQQIGMQWVALLDSKTSERCRSLNGKHSISGKPFQAKDGWQGLRPPAHPRCRSTLVPYRPEWADIFEDVERRLDAASVSE